MIAAIISLLSAVAGLFSRLLDWMQSRATIEKIDKADKSIEDARAEHSKDATDNAFDKDFWRD